MFAPLHFKSMKPLLCWYPTSAVHTQLLIILQTFHSNNKPLLLLMAEILHQFIGSLSHYSYGFIHPRWCKMYIYIIYIYIYLQVQHTWKKHWHITTNMCKNKRNSFPHIFNLYTTEQKTRKPETQLSNEKNPGWLGFKGDYTTQLYRDFYKSL